MIKIKTVSKNVLSLKNEQNFINPEIYNEVLKHMSDQGKARKYIYLKPPTYLCHHLDTCPFFMTTILVAVIQKIMLNYYLKIYKP